ncbi:MAG: carbamoyltransferase HypF [Candidatus Electrothrix aestuarii]|uniref:Carbamoyltransferase n=1 Tax=Candidatus Electrothrix aestuarii TaxID=3062594 RepID=A0AAU8LWY0_9BACT|nr:carbamoyltransferase HypF [Candidatus Electrothrix aestuarii]
MFVRVQGLVQGVGFRPFVYGLATRLELCGWVRNTSAEVEILVQGQDDDLENFLAYLKNDAPSLARIHSITTEPDSSTKQQTNRYRDFTILPSAEQPGKGQPITPVTPDASLCPSCEEELLNPADRRYLYPFISCTNCGPRFTIIQDLPVDRQRTVMQNFPLCPTCQVEYDNPLDRRFHAQASACPVCGPRLSLHEIKTSRRGEPVCSPSPDSVGARRAVPLHIIGQTHRSAPTNLDSLLTARRLLRKGKILAIKGLGGFHLACDAENPEAVAELRRRKGRPDKPFALMATDLEQIKNICQISEVEAKLLQGPEKPIVLLEKKNVGAGPCACPVRRGTARRAPTSNVAPNLDRLGCMLPYTPLHLLLLNQTDPLLAQESAPALLVMTSGNRSGEPIITENEKALARLAPLADALLLHDRPIHSRCDDSVLRIDSGKRTALFLRRSRGYAPYPIQLPFTVEPILAVGGQLKNTFCLAEGRQALLSQHIGDMDEVATCNTFEASVQQAGKLFRIQPKYIAHDLHPQYFTSRYAQRESQRNGLPCLAAQHHHAHIAACMADNGLEDRKLIGLVFDGTGYGPDGTIWGGEVLIASYGAFERFAHLQCFPLPGGEAAIRQPWRIAVGAAHSLDIASAELDDLPFLDHIEPQALSIIRQQVNKQINCPQTSSLGRLFDAAASLIGIRNQVNYEAQAAIELEVLAKPYLNSTTSYPSDLFSTDDSERAVPLQGLFRAIIEDVRRQKPAGMIGARLHHTLAQLAITLCRKAQAATGLQEVALSGGVWQNQLLLDLVRQGLEEQGLTVYCHQLVPCNDGGLALGQLAVASHQIE